MILILDVILILTRRLERRLRLWKMLRLIAR
jgi:hypothetical protein